MKEMEVNYCPACGSKKQSSTREHEHVFKVVCESVQILFRNLG